jgi:hypothetical protein
MDKWLKRIWLLNGIGLLTILVILLFTAIVDRWPTPHDPTGAVASPPTHSGTGDSTIIQDLIPGMPTPIGRSNFTHIGLTTRDLTAPLPATSSRLSTYYETNPHDNAYMNIIFQWRDGSHARLLLDSKAYIPLADIPSAADSLRTFILLKIGFADTDGDGRIGPGDSTHLFVCDLDGERLVRVLPPTAELEEYEISDVDQTIHVRAAIRPANPKIERVDWPQHLFRYDVRRRTLSRYPEVDSVLSVAKHILWKQ